mgnify:CR=1 FL=1
MLKEFKAMVKLPKPKKHYGKKVAHGAVGVVKVPWKFVSKFLFQPNNKNSHKITLTCAFVIFIKLSHK